MTTRPLWDDGNSGKVKGEGTVVPVLD